MLAWTQLNLEFILQNFLPNIESFKLTLSVKFSAQYINYLPIRRHNPQKSPILGRNQV